MEGDDSCDTMLFINTGANESYFAVLCDAIVQWKS